MPCFLKTPEALPVSKKKGIVRNELFTFCQQTPKHEKTPFIILNL